MAALRNIAVAVPALGVVAAAIAFGAYRGAMRQAERAWNSVAAGAQPLEDVFDPTSIRDLPEIAQRYFNHAIVPGTPLKSVIELRMQGTFVLGDKDNQ